MKRTVSRRTPHSWLTVIILLFLSFGLSAATTDTFTGVIDNTWENSDNWSESSPPANGELVVIPLSTVAVLNTSSNAIGGLTVNGELDIGAVDSSTTGNLFWSGNQSWSGNGLVVFGGSLTNSIEDSNNTSTETLTLLSHLQIRGGNGAIGNDSAAAATVIQCSIQCSDFSLLGPWSCTGSINGGNGGETSFGTFNGTQLGGTFSTASALTVSGKVALVGTLNNSGGNLPINGSVNSWDMMGTSEIIGGTVTVTNSATGLAFLVRGGILNGVTISGGTVTIEQFNPPSPIITIENGITLSSGAEMDIFGTLHWLGTQSWGGTGVIDLKAVNPIITNSDVSGNPVLTILDGLTISAAGIFGDFSGGTILNEGVVNVTDDQSVDANLVNTGAINVSSGGILNIGAIGSSWINTGVITCDNGSINLGGNFSTNSVNSITTSNSSVIDIQGLLDNTGATLTLNANTGSWNLNGGTITGGTISTNGINDLVATANGGMLDGVIFSSGSSFDMTSAGANATVVDGITVNGAINVGATNGSTTGTLFWSGNQSWGGAGAILFGGNSSDSIVHANSLAETLTIVPPLGIGHPLSITATSAIRMYGAANPVFSFTEVGLQNSDTVTGVTETTPASIASPVGSYSITPSAAVFGTGLAASYVISYVPAALSISTAPLSLTASNATMTAGSSVPVLGFTSSGFVNGDTSADLTIQPTVSTTATSSSPVGTYPITIAGATDPNYSITYVSGTLTITAASITGGSTATGGTTGSATASSGGGGCGLGAGELGIIGLMLLGMRKLNAQTKR